MNYVREYLNDGQQPNFSGLRLIGAGLSKTGTMSIKAGLGMLLNGSCFHGGCLFTCSREELDFWNRAMDGDTIERQEWVDMLQGRGFRAGVDFPFAIFYKELMLAYPDAKVLLSTRDPEAWHDSLLDTVSKVHKGRDDWAIRLFMRLTGQLYLMDTVVKVFDVVVQPMGKSVTQALEEGKESTVQFYQDWVAEVKRSVPKERLLEFSVREGWAPLCKFLDLPIPKEEFPRKNERKMVENVQRKADAFIYATVYGLPLVIAVFLYYAIQSYLSIM